MIPSKRVYQLLGSGTGVGLVIAVLITDPNRPIFLSGLLVAILLWDGLVLGLAWWDSWRVNLQRAQVSRESIDRLSIARENPIRLHLHTQDQAAILQIRDYYPAGFRVVPDCLQIELPPQTQQVLTYTVYPTQRGQYQWGQIQIRQLGRWRLGWHNWTIPQAQTVEVYPDLIGLRSLSIRLTLKTTGTMKQIHRTGVGTEFAELREYGIGDDPRRIDWKASARRDRPLLRVMEPEQEQTLIILLDRGRLMTAQVQGIARFDWGLNAALSLALAGLHRGDRVGMGVFDRHLSVWLPPERGQHQLAKLIERLTPIEPVLLESDYLGAVSSITRQQTRRALVVLITDLVDKTASAELLTAMAHLTPRYLPFCVTLRDPTIDQVANRPNSTIPDAYARSVAIDLGHQRQVALATLKQKGVLILDAPANQLTEPLIDRYLQLKARSLL